MNKTIYYTWSKIGIEIAFKQMRFKKTSRLPRLEINCKMKGLISLHNLINKPIVSGVSNFGNHSLWDESLTKTLKAFSEDNNNKNLNKDNEQSKKHIFKDNW